MNQKQLKIIKNTIIPAIGDISNINNINVICLCYPKTGSTSLAMSFQNSIDSACNKLGDTAKKTQFRDVLHLHSNESCLWNLDKNMKKNNIGIQDLIIYRLKNNSKKLILVTAYREPISRSLSQFNHFLSYDKNTQKVICDRYGKNYNVDNLIEYFKNNFKFGINKYLYDQYKEYFNIDLFKKPFNKKEGIIKYKKGNIIVFFVRFDKLNSNSVKRFIRKNTEYKDFEMIKMNSGDNNIYNSLKAKIKFTENEINKIFDLESNVLKYFYSANEISDIKKNIVVSNNSVF